MAELNLKQITDKLNTEFTGEVRKLVFWYDANAEFAEDVDTLELGNAKVLHLEQDNQFYTKYFLECVDTTSNYLVYAPFAKPISMLRYEVGMTLFEKLQADEKCTATMKTMASTLPFVIQCGVEALLPHRILELTDDYSVLVDGQKVETLEQRQAALQKYNPASLSVQYDDISVH